MPDPLPPWARVTASGRLPDALRRAGCGTRLHLPAGTPRGNDHPRRVRRGGRDDRRAAVRRAVRDRVDRRRGVALPPQHRVAGAAVAGAGGGRADRSPPRQSREAQLNWVPVAAPADQVAAVVQAYTAVPDEQDNTWRMADAQYMPNCGDGRPSVDAPTRAACRGRRWSSSPPASTKLRDCFY